LKPTPQKITSKDGELRIAWSDGHQSRYVWRDLRLSCRCAACVDEWTHQSLIKPDTVPAQIKPKVIGSVGNYAMHITWSDGHNTGIYSYDYLREVCDCDECKKPRSFDV
jgi:DUF971 family protein